MQKKQRTYQNEFNLANVGTVHINNFSSHFSFVKANGTQWEKFKSSASDFPLITQ